MRIRRRRRSRRRSRRRRIIRRRIRRVLTPVEQQKTNKKRSALTPDEHNKHTE